MARDFADEHRLAVQGLKAAKYSRKAVNGAGVATFSRRIQGKGDKCIASGTVERIRGKRYVAIALSKPRYYSRDDLEDFDMFDQEPGLWYDWQGVEVEPTEDERAADEKAAAKKTEEERAAKRRKEITSLVCNAENQVDHLPPGLQDCWGRRGMAGSGDEQQKGGQGGRRKGGHLGSRISPVAGLSIPGRCPHGQLAGRHVVGVLLAPPPFLAFRLAWSR